jgi:RNA polymerase sigma-70 factor (ECF subfamily)
MAQPPQLAWFDDLLERHFRQLVAFAHGLLGDVQAAHDVVQETFVAAWRATEQQKPPFAPTLDAAGAHRWLFRVAYNRAISARRHATSLTWESLDQSDALADSVSPVQPPFEDRVVEEEALAAALARLTPEDAACILIHVVHGCTAAEVARILEISPEAAKKRISRAIERLRTIYFSADGVPAGTRGRS